MAYSMMCLMALDVPYTRLTAGVSGSRAGVDSLSKRDSVEALETA
jgi:hypothetical protein